MWSGYVDLFHQLCVWCEILACLGLTGTGPAWSCGGRRWGVKLLFSHWVLFSCCFCLFVWTKIRYVVVPSLRQSWHQTDSHPPASAFLWWDWRIIHTWQRWPKFQLIKQSFWVILPRNHQCFPDKKVVVCPLSWLGFLCSLSSLSKLQCCSVWGFLFSFALLRCSMQACLFRTQLPHPFSSPRPS